MYPWLEKSKMPSGLPMAHGTEHAQADTVAERSTVMTQSRAADENVPPDRSDTVSTTALDDVASRSSLAPSDRAVHGSDGDESVDVEARLEDRSSSKVRRKARRRPRPPLRWRLRELKRTVRRSAWTSPVAIGAMAIAAFVAISMHNDVSLPSAEPAASDDRVTVAGERAPSTEVAEERTASAEATPAEVAEQRTESVEAAPVELAERRPATAEVSSAPLGSVSMSGSAEMAADAPTSESSGTVTVRSSATPGRTPDTVLATAVRVRDPVVHVVNEGGSWWRTARRVIDDSVSIDRLMDNLSASGMNVERVTPGAELVVDAAAADGVHLVRIDAPSGVYVSRVDADGVRTSRYRSVPVTIESAFGRDAAAAGVPREAIEQLLRANAEHSLGLESVAHGTSYDVLLRTERDFGSSRATTRVLALSESGGVLLAGPGAAE